MGQSIKRNDTAWLFIFSNVLDAVEKQVTRDICKHGRWVADSYESALFVELYNSNPVDDKTAERIPLTSVVYNEQNAGILPFRTNLSVVYT